MRAVLSCVVLVAACGHSDSSGAGSAQVSARPVTPPVTPPSPAPAAVPAAIPAPPPTPPTPAPNVNCAELLTTHDVTEICGPGTEVKAETNPIAVQYSLCALMVTVAGKNDRLASIGLLDKHDATEADNWTKIEFAAGTPVTGLGDRAWQKVSDHPDRHSTGYDVGVMKGRLVLHIASDKNELVPHPPCTIDQMTELARRATSRLP